MRTCLIATASAVLLSLTGETEAAPKTSKKETEKMVILSSEKELRENFSFFPYPLRPWGAVPVEANGVYRVHLSAEGRVTEINVVRSMGPVLNGCVTKALTRWKAKQNAPRIVGVGFYYFNLAAYMNTR